ncbi:MAG: LamG domain-containing protein, partial [Myxococcales bacterium]|nr:LamG domain-containing protein [Myxococcales bacterium]
AGTASMTIEVLVYPEDFPDDYQQLVGKRRVMMGPPKIEDGYSLSIDPAGLVVFARLNASGSRNVVAAIEPNRFSHVVATFDNATGTSAIWINGDFGEANGTAGEIALVSTSEPFRVGGKTNIDFFGKLDELAIYDRALEQSEVEEHFQALPPP